MLIKRLRQISPQLLLYFSAIIFMGAASGCFDTSYNNFLDGVFRISAERRGMLEFPRELPGFLVAAMTGLLATLPETGVASISGLVTFVGMMGLSWVHLIDTNPGAWQWMVLFTILWSTGSHLGMPVQASIGMSLAHESKRGRRLGQMGALAAVGSIIGAALAWILSGSRSTPPYWLIFATGGTMALAAAVTFVQIRGVGRHAARPRLIIRRKYWLYYVLCVLFGARKQIFMTFGPWVLIKVFHRSVDTFAKLRIVNSLLTVFTNPFIGSLIDRWGERRVLMVDSFLLMLVCLGYGASHLFGSAGVWVAFACFVLDEVIFGFGMARTIYLSKIAEKPEHVTASLGLGVSLDHAVSMTLPTLGGMLWMRYGHPWVFFAGGMIGLLMTIFSSLIVVPPREVPEEVEEAAATPVEPGI
jgi:predicted MFS family arabinose efflux permease